MAIASLLLGACNSSGCLDNQSSIPLAQFRSSGNGADISVPGLQIHGIGAPNDSVIPISGSQVYLPMRASDSNTSWCFHYAQEGLDDPELNDTISFTYESTPFFASEECGAMYRYVITDFTYTRHLIDSVGLLDSVITNVDRERIRIYFRTATEDEDEDDGNDENEDTEAPQPPTGDDNKQPEE